LREGGERLPTAGLSLAHTEIGELWSSSLRLQNSIAVALSSVTLLARCHCDQHFTGSALGPQPQVSRLPDHLRVFGLPRVGLHRHRLVADGFDLVDAKGLVERTMGGVVFDEFHHAASPEALPSAMAIERTGGRAVIASPPRSGERAASGDYLDPLEKRSSNSGRTASRGLVETSAGLTPWRNR
jgi:hypothetical protein